MPLISARWKCDDCGAEFESAGKKVYDDWQEGWEWEWEPRWHDLGGTQEAVVEVICDACSDARRLAYEKAKFESGEWVKMNDGTIYERPTARNPMGYYYSADGHSGWPGDMERPAAPGFHQYWR